MQGTKARRTVILAAVAALSVAISGCAKSDRDSGGGSSASGQTSSKDTLVFGAAGDPKLFDPAFASDGETFRVLKQVFEGLVKTKEGSAEIEPALATKWENSSDGKEWTFTLRQGVKFSDGTAFDAAAVCYNFDRWYNFTGALQSPDVSAYWQDTFGGFKKNESADLPPSLYKSCTATGTDTAKIALTDPTGRIPAALALPSFAMQSPTALKKFNADNAPPPVTPSNTRRTRRPTRPAPARTSTPAATRRRRPSRSPPTPTTGARSRRSTRSSSR